jgi:hypothetical protein
MLRQKSKKKSLGILREETIQKIYLNQFRTEFNTVDPYFFVDNFKGIVHKKFTLEFRKSQFNFRCQIHTMQLVLILACWSIEIIVPQSKFIFSTRHRSVISILGCGNPV